MSIRSSIEQAGRDGKLLESSVKNLLDWVEGGFLPNWAKHSIEELVDQSAWDELNDRFYQFLAFGTGGMRNRTIGNIVTAAERGDTKTPATPAHAAVGTAVLNDFNIVRATIGLYKYCERHLREKTGRREIPRLVIAHDVRHFSRHFCELTASTWTRLGGYAMIFEGPRSTPQLSFTVRETGATAGIVITASHNPSHDNGYKVYFEDGAQVVFPHAEGIIHEVYQVQMAETVPFLDIDMGQTVVLPESMDTAYLNIVGESPLLPDLFKETDLKLVFSPIHGTGAISAVPALKLLGLEVETVAEQMVQDGNFPSVKSPNPENAEALAMALKQADETQADLVMATDPDADRLGAAVRDRDGKLMLLNGNTIGSLLAAYRVDRLKEMGLIPENGSQRAAVIKTFVTTPLQASIAEKNGLKLIDTLTGFKWIGEKLRIYEEELVQAYYKDTGIWLDYNRCSSAKRRELLLKYSTYYVFGGEESYGYLANDRVRDKDANAAVVMFVELAAWLKKQGKSFPDYLDDMYLRYGYYAEDVINIYYEGAAGASKIRKILESYRAEAPKAIGEYEVTAFRDFGVQDLEDADGKSIPKQDFYFIELDNDYSFAVRGSGTEPKIKFYLFAREDVAQPLDLEPARKRAKATIAELKKAVEADARKRAEN
ncbi:MAG: phospho-sugar mutase [Opitutales bacterium]|nr:phospho-sugar mutase [Opitutales bacterium]